MVLPLGANTATFRLSPSDCAGDGPSSEGDFASSGSVTSMHSLRRSGSSDSIELMRSRVSSPTPRNAGYSVARMEPKPPPPRPPVPKHYLAKPTQSFYVAPLGLQAVAKSALPAAVASPGLQAVAKRALLAAAATLPAKRAKLQPGALRDKAEQTARTLIQAAVAKLVAAAPPPAQGYGNSSNSNSNGKPLVPTPPASPRRVAASVTPVPQTPALTPPASPRRVATPVTPLPPPPLCAGSKSNSSSSSSNCNRVPPKPPPPQRCKSPHDDAAQIRKQAVEQHIARRAKAESEDAHAQQRKRGGRKWKWK